VHARDGSVTALLLCRGIDPTALQTCNLFAFVPATTVAAITQLPLAWVELYSGYLYYVAKTFGGAAFQSYVLGGPLLSPDAGGFIANKTIYQWLYGEPPHCGASGHAATEEHHMGCLLTVNPVRKGMDETSAPVVDLARNLTTARRGTPSRTSCFNS